MCPPPRHALVSGRSEEGVCLRADGSQSHTRLSVCVHPRLFLLRTASATSIHRALPLVLSKSYLGHPNIVSVSTVCLADSL